MNPASRVSIVLSVLKVLESKSHREISIIFQSFIGEHADSFNYYGDWERDILMDADDHDLLGIAQYLALDLPESTAATLFPDAWSSSGIRIFFSHSSKYKKWVASVAELLREYGFHVFVAHDDIKPSKEWIVQIQRALSTCDALLAHITDEFVDSEWCDQEAGFALGRQIPVVPIYERRIQGLIGLHQGIERKQEATDHNLATQIIQFLIDNDRTRVRTIDSLTDTFLESGSFEHAKQLMDVLEQIPDGFAETHAKRLRKAVDENHQVSRAFGVPNRVDKLIEKHDLEYDPAQTDHDDIPF